MSCHVPSITAVHKHTLNSVSSQREAIVFFAVLTWQQAPSWPGSAAQRR
jgi:hypothetical protein